MLSHIDVGLSSWASLGQAPTPWTYAGQRAASCLSRAVLRTKFSGQALFIQLDLSTLFVPPTDYTKAEPSDRFAGVDHSKGYRDDGGDGRSDLHDS